MAETIPTVSLVSIVELEDDYVVKQDSFNIGEGRPGLWPSEASVAFMQDGRRRVYGTCQRAAWYRSSGLLIPGEASAGLIWKGHLGKRVEESQVNKWKEMGLFIANNVKFYDRELIVSGEMDAIIKHPNTGGMIGYEIKSFYGYYANKGICGAKRDQIPGKPKMNQFLQSCIYAFKFRDKLEEFRMMYIERGDGHRVEFKVGFLESNGEFYPYWQQVPGPYWSHFEPKPAVQLFTVREIHNRYKELVKRIRNKELPPRDYPAFYSEDEATFLYGLGELGKTEYEKFIKNPKKHKLIPWQCSYCQYKDQCKVDDEA